MKKSISYQGLYTFLCILFAIFIVASFVTVNLLIHFSIGSYPTAIEAAMAKEKLTDESVIYGVLENGEYSIVIYRKTNENQKSSLGTVLTLRGKNGYHYFRYNVIAKIDFENEYTFIRYNINDKYLILIESEGTVLTNDACFDSAGTDLKIFNTEYKDENGNIVKYGYWLILLDDLPKDYTVTVNGTKRVIR